MNHVKTYPGEETSWPQNQTVEGPDCAILADFSSITFRKGSCSVMRLACSHHDTVFQVQQLFRFLSGGKNRPRLGNVANLLCSTVKDHIGAEKGSIWFPS